MCEIITTFTLADNRSWTAVWAVANGRDPEAAIECENKRAERAAWEAANPVQGCKLPPANWSNWTHPLWPAHSYSSGARWQDRVRYEWAYGQRGYRETYLY